jgi:pSer/pThr/pTyr-binding forkhead associated (FHA) protein
MLPSITLTAKNGRLEGKKYVFTDRQKCIIGRSRDCDLQINDGLGYRSVSRHHCLLTIDPPGIRVRDLSSHNGTFVNGERLDSYAFGRITDDVLGLEEAEYELKDGDKLRIGGLVFKVNVNRPLETHEWIATHHADRSALRSVTI